MRKVLLSGVIKPLGPTAETILFAAARIDHIDKTIEPALAAGTWVISDRFAEFDARLSGRGRRCRTAPHQCARTRDAWAVLRRLDPGPRSSARSRPIARCAPARGAGRPPIASKARISGFTRACARRSGDCGGQSRPLRRHRRRPLGGRGCGSDLERRFGQAVAFAGYGFRAWSLDRLPTGPPTRPLKPIASKMRRTRAKRRLCSAMRKRKPKSCALAHRGDCRRRFSSADRQASAKRRSPGASPAFFSSIPIPARPRRRQRARVP